MEERPHTPGEPTRLTTFTSQEYVIVGAGETIDEIQLSGEWLKTDTIVEVRR